MIEPSYLPPLDAALRRDLAYSANERRLLALIRDKAPISRADLARETGLTLQSIVRLVGQLMEQGLLHGGEKVAYGPGQPSLPISLTADAAFSLGVSIMDDALAAVLVDMAGAIRAETYELFDTSSRQRVAGRLEQILSRLIEERALDRSRMIGVGVAVPGFFTDSPGRVNAPLTMEEWSLDNIADQLGGALGLPVWIENDGSAAAAGESLYGAGRFHRTFAYLYIGSGLGGGLVIDGRPWRGSHGNAGEFTGLLAPEARATRPTLDLLLRMVNRRGIAIASVGDLLRRFDPEWPEIGEWLEATRETTSALISAAASLVDPEAIVIGGRIPPELARKLAENSSFFSVPVRGRDRHFPIIRPQKTIGDAAAMGAASLPFLHRYF